jgi:hypothetical protein
MIKISANLSKKVPLPGVDFSSQQFGASMEIEISDADRPDAIKQRIAEVYALLGQTVDEQIAATKAQLPPPRQAVPAQQSRRYQPQNGRNGNGRPVMATVAQQRALHAICKSLNVDLKELLASYNVTDASQLTVRDASALIDDLKSQQNGNSTPRQ